MIINSLRLIKNADSKKRLIKLSKENFFSRINSINFFKYFKNIINLELRNFYLNTSYYDSKISKLDKKNLIYRPNLSTFDSIIKYDKEKINIENTDAKGIVIKDTLIKCTLCNADKYWTKEPWPNLKWILADPIIILLSSELIFSLI